METTQANLATDGRVLPRQAPLTFSSGNVHSSVTITIRLDKFGTLLLLHRFHTPMNEVSNRAAY